jgi:thioredoxin 1
MALQLNDQNFSKEVLDAKGVVLVDFWAPWCGPCQMLSPIIGEIATKFENNSKVKICKVNVDEASKIAEEQRIMSIPLLRFFKDGEMVAELVGLQSMEVIESKINELIAS